MSWMAVAEKDFRDAIRSRLVLVLAALFIVFVAGGAGLGVAFGVGGGGGASLILALLLGGAGVLVPLIAIGVSYRAVAGERSTGSLKVLLSLPNSRADVVVGKFLGRSLVVSIAVIAGFLTGLVAFAAAIEGELQLSSYLAFMVTTLLLGLVFVSIAVSVSAFTASTFRAAVGAFGLFILFEWLWGIIRLLLWYVANGFEAPGFSDEAPEWVDLFEFLSPNVAYSEATSWLVDRLVDQPEQQAQFALEPYGLEGWFGFLVMLAWIVVPLAFGYLRFESADL